MDLGGAVTDATTMVELLVGTLGFDPADVRLLTDGAATRAAILRSLDEWLIAGSRPGDRVVFYFAGHGATASVAEGTGRRLTSTLVPHDAEGDLDGDRPTVSRMIQGREIRPYLDRLADRRVTVVTDACHSGSVIGQARVTVRQDGDDAGSAEPDGSAFTRMTVYRVSITE